MSLSRTLFRTSCFVRVKYASSVQEVIFIISLYIIISLNYTHVAYYVETTCILKHMNIFIKHGTLEVTVTISLITNIVTHNLSRIDEQLFRVLVLFCLVMTF
jgi:hypothetical protein